MVRPSLILILVTLDAFLCLAADEPSPGQLSSAKQEAAAADLQFFIEFLDDFNVNLVSYTSYMNEAKMTLPQDVANYYYHLKSVTETTQLLDDLATSFPFTEFKTFITAFPWYSSILSEASATDFYVPDDFITQQAEVPVTSSIAPSTGQVTRPPATTPASLEGLTTDLPSNSSSTIVSNVSTTTVTAFQSVNLGSKTDKYVPLLILAILCYLF